MNKYILTNTTKVVNGRTLFQIKAEVDINSKSVKKGDLGGFIEKTTNVKQILS